MQINKSKLSNYLVTLKNKKFGNFSVSIPEFKSMCIARIAIPDLNHPDKVFISNYQILYGDEKPWPEPEVPKKSPRPKIRAFWTSRRLLEHVIRSTHLAVDTTFKLTWQGFPVFMCGTTDLDKRYHPFGLGLCSEETFHDHAFIFDSIKKAALEVYGFELKPTVLLADAASEITNGFTRVFGEPVQYLFFF